MKHLIMHQHTQLVISVLSSILLIISVGCANQTLDEKRAQIANSSVSIEVSYPPDEEAKAKVVRTYKRGDKEFAELVASFSSARPFKRSMATSLDFRYVTIVLRDGAKIRLAVCIADGKFSFLDESSGKKQAWLQFPMSRMSLVE